MTEALLRAALTGKGRKEAAGNTKMANLETKMMMK